MDRLKKKRLRRIRLKTGLRKKISGNTARPRLTVYRSNKEIYAQIIDDSTGATIVAASSLQDEGTKVGTPVETAKAVGKVIAQKALEASIDKVVFDRNGYLYHGRIQALAEGAREGGLNF